MALSLLLSIFLLWSLVSTSTAFNITKILDQQPDYAAFNQLLTKTHVAQEINKRKSITVLAVPNGAISGMASQDEETISVIMKIHVVLDYYDSAKIKKIHDDATLTTLYQTTGWADREEGFLRVDKDGNEIKLISADPGSSVSARVTKVVTSIPSDISVVEVTNAIMPAGLTGSPISPSPSSKSSKHKSPTPSPSDDDDDADDSKSAPSDDDAPAPAPKKHGHDHKHKHKHTPAPAPSDDDSSDGDGASDDDADAADDADADANDDSSPDDGDDRMSDEDDSSSPRNAVVSSGFVLLASLFAML